MKKILIVGLLVSLAACAQGASDTFDVEQVAEKVGAEEPSFEIPSIDVPEFDFGIDQFGF